MKWTPDQDAYLKRYYHDISARDIGRFLGYTKQSVIGRAFRLGLSEKKSAGRHPSIKWTSSMDEMLADLYKKHTIKEIAPIFGASRGQCASRVSKLGLRKQKNKIAVINAEPIRREYHGTTRTITPKLYRPEHIKHTGYTLKDISPQQCHWPMGDPKQPDFCYCGKGGVNKPYGYCKEHRELSIEKSNKVSKKLR